MTGPSGWDNRPRNGLDIEGWLAGNSPHRGTPLPAYETPPPAYRAPPSSSIVTTKSGSARTGFPYTRGLREWDYVFTGGYRIANQFTCRSEFDEQSTLLEALRQKNLYRDISVTTPELREAVAKDHQERAREHMKYLLCYTDYGNWRLEVHYEFLNAVFQSQSQHENRRPSLSLRRPRACWRTPTAPWWDSLRIGPRAADLPALNPRCIHFAMQIDVTYDPEIGEILKRLFIRRSTRDFDLWDYLSPWGGTTLEMLAFGVVFKGPGSRGFGYNQLRTWAYVYFNCISTMLSQCMLPQEESYTMPLLLIRDEHYYLFFAHAIFERSGAIKSVSFSEPDISREIRSLEGAVQMANVIQRLVDYTRHEVLPWFKRILSDLASLPSPPEEEKEEEEEEEEGRNDSAQSESQEADALPTRTGSDQGTMEEQEEHRNDPVRSPSLGGESPARSASDQASSKRQATPGSSCSVYRPSKRRASSASPPLSKRLRSHDCP